MARSRERPSPVREPKPGPRRFTLGTDDRPEPLCRCRARALLLALRPRPIAMGSFMYNPTTGDLSLSSKTILTLAPRQLLLPQHKHGWRRVHPGAHSGSVLIKVNGVIDGGGGSFANLTNDPANLRMESSYKGSRGIRSAAATSVLHDLCARYRRAVEGWRNDLWRGRWKDVVDVGRRGAALR